MRRKFNRDYLVTKPPQKGLHFPKVYDESNYSNRSKFNHWFCRMIAQLQISNKQFAVLSGQPYETIMGWRTKHNPQRWGRFKIAETFSSLGLGDKKDLFKRIELLCNSEKKKVS
tara:strand:- start:497 stop:838 length:342 start_codon:yes stop_codon:yes gene_type:complete